jgi:hypothetical protein
MQGFSIIQKFAGGISFAFTEEFADLLQNHYPDSNKHPTFALQSK